MRLLTSFFALAVTTQTVLAGVLTNLESRCFGPLTGYIRVYNTFKPNTTETRYLSKSTDTASRQKYQGAVYYTTDKSQAALVSIDQCTQPFFVQCTVRVIFPFPTSRSDIYVSHPPPCRTVRTASSTA